MKEDYGHYRNTDYVWAWDKIKLASARPDGLEDLSQGLPKVHAIFIDVVRKKLLSIKSFKVFTYNCEQILTLMANFPLQKPCIFVRVLKCAVDKIALALPPFVQVLYPNIVCHLSLLEMANCMLGSLCIEFFGNDS
ncbi:hypothetical protein PoB_002849800 [Plakobranchus ocellatus]|uniref:Uncharacterized protein n=1 Tax=Plakobranchus ocellatus TaxID=259542 RepID=A0AAV4A5T9_9GAST|nr:hypothetical protein PoB_002849800 [Plakobranchus ocellatus]